MFLACRTSRPAEAADYILRQTMQTGAGLGERRRHHPAQSAMGIEQPRRPPRQRPHGRTRSGELLNVDHRDSNPNTIPTHSAGPPRCGCVRPQGYHIGMGLPVADLRSGSSLGSKALTFGHRPGAHCSAPRSVSASATFTGRSMYAGQRPSWRSPSQNGQGADRGTAVGQV